MSHWYIEDNELHGEFIPGSIDDSIEKWEFLANNYTADLMIQFVSTCSLCQKYNTEFVSTFECDGCPVNDYNGDMSCSGTPYTRMWGLYVRQHNIPVFAPDRRPSKLSPDEVTALGRQYAAEEVEFLRAVKQDAIERGTYRSVDQLLKECEE